MEDDPRNELLGGPDWFKSQSEETDIQPLTLKLPKYCHTALRAMEEHFLKVLGTADAHGAFHLSFAFGDCLTEPFSGSLSRVIGEPSSVPRSATHQFRHQIESAAMVMETTIEVIKNQAMWFSNKLDTSSQMLFMASVQDLLAEDVRLFQSSKEEPEE